MDSREFMKENVENDVIEEIKKEDKKSLGKFVIIMICSALIGGFTGFGIAFAEDMNLTEGIAVFAVKLLEAMAPYANVVLTAVASVIIMVLYRKSRKQYAEWDEEDEEGMNRIEEKLNYALMISAVTLILGYMFLTIGFAKIDTLTKLNAEVILFVLGFIFLMAFSFVAQRKIINFSKEMNPEKRGSVFDMKFHEKWENSCDEAELLTIYKAAYAAYKSTNMACLGAWVFCMFGMMIWDFGYVPVVIITVIWLTSTISYCMNAIKLSKNPVRK